MTKLNPKNIKISALDENTSLPKYNRGTVSDQLPIYSAPFNDRLDQAIRLYREGMEGNETAVQQANVLLERLRFDYPPHPLVDAYHGSTMVLIARDKPRTIDKLRWSKNGLKLLDKAVAAAPQNALIRLLRGKAAYNLPEKYFRRTLSALEDYTFLIEQEFHEGGLLNAEEYSQLIYELGDAYHRIGRNQDAEVCWKKLENLMQTPELQQLLRQKLLSLEGKPAIEKIATEDFTSMLIGATRTVGYALQSWSKHEKKKAARRERKKKKNRR